MTLFKGWHTGLASMRNVKLRKTWKQRVRRLRLGRRKTEIIWRIGETADEMVVVSDRLHDLDDVPLAGAKVPIRWWHGADGWRRVEAVKSDDPLTHRMALEINATTAVPFLLNPMGRLIWVERAYHAGNGWCITERYQATVTRFDFYTVSREEVFRRLRLTLEYVRGDEPPPEISYAEFLELDTSSFWDGWKRWFTEWIRFARVSIFGDR